MGKDIIQGSAYCCAGAAAAVTASQAAKRQAAVKALGNAAVVGFGKVGSGVKWVANCAGGACRAVANKFRGRSMDGRLAIDPPLLERRAVYVPADGMRIVVKKNI